MQNISHTSNKGSWRGSHGNSQQKQKHKILSTISPLNTWMQRINRCFQLQDLINRNCTRSALQSCKPIREFSEIPPIPKCNCLPVPSWSFRCIQQGSVGSGCTGIYSWICPVWVVSILPLGLQLC